MFGITMENLRFYEVWPNGRFGMIRNATRKDFGVEAWFSGIVLELPKHWNRFRTFPNILDFSLDFAYTRDRRFACHVVWRNGLRGCVCF